MAREQAVLALWPWLSLQHCYASTLAEVGESDENLDSIFADLEKVGPFAKDEQFWKFFTSPVVKDDDKKAVVKTLSKEVNLTASTTNLLYLLVTKKRTLSLKDLLKEFEVIYNKLTDTEVALVTSAIEMDKSQLSLIGKKVQSMSGSKNVKLKNIIDPSIIAGFIVRFGEDGSRLIDMSVKGQLEKIASQIESTNKVFRSVLNIKVEFSLNELGSALLTPNTLLDTIHITFGFCHICTEGWTS
ncbi:hypothetical protein GOP47_0016496 [Adiantum capillus-veneris]|uniref:Uncharacterized protein n=1 Tax=Adiantum capillus-veneris TaxID=13818 RepID=A0A9D4UHS7_ADICA|nr:hypothetical protein GOP47_0016496 [Adiantum capillus-veneris]